MRVYSRSIGKASPLILALAALVISASGHAQPVSPEGENPSNRRTIEEVIVTAQKKEESMQDVPVSMTYVGGVELEERALYNMDEITAAAPNVIANTSNLNYAFYIRGMGTDNPFFAQSVVTIIDGLPTTRPQALWGAFQDIDRIEILRGPQGTLFGKGTVAGVINIVTNKPNYEWSAKAIMTKGRFDTDRFEGLVNIPLVDEKLAMRLSYGQEESEGYMYNTFLNRTEGGYKKVSISPKFLWDINPDMDLLLTLTYAEDNFPQGYGYQATAIREDHRDLAEDTDPEFETNLDRSSSKNIDEVASSRYASAKLKFGWDIDDYRLTFVSGYDDVKFNVFYDCDWGPTNGCTWGVYDDGPNVGWYNELRVLSPPSLLDDRLDFIVGGFYSYTQYPSRMKVYVNTVPGIGLPIPFIGTVPLPVDGEQAAETFDLYLNQVVKSMGAFGQATYKITDSWDVLLGLRYSETELEGDDYENRLYTGDLQVAGPLATTGGYGNRKSIDQRRIDRSSDYKVSNRYFFNEAIMAYATVATGFKSGGYGAQIYEDGTIDDFNPEDSINYEVGVKAGLLDGLARINFAVFDTYFNGLQVSGFDGLRATLENAGTARSRGAELETQFILPAGLLLTFNTAYLHGRFVDFKQAVCAVDDTENVQDDGNPNTTDTCDYSGNPLPYSPEWSASLQLAGEWNIGWGLLLNAGVDINYQDDMFFQPDADIDDSQSSYTLINTRLGLRSETGRWRLTAFFKNVEDLRYTTNGRDMTILNGHWKSMGPPRNLNVSLSMEF